MDTNIITIRCTLIGSSGVGKTSVLNRYIDNDFKNHFISTIGVDFRCKRFEIDGKTIKLQIWDTASQERFRSITNNYYRTSDIIILFYDTTSEHSYNDLEYWMNDIKKYALKSVTIGLCGTKIDLKTLRKIKSTDAQQYSEYNEIPNFEISSKDNVGIDEMFNELIRIKLADNTFIQQNNEKRDIIIDVKDVIKLDYVIHTVRDEYGKCCMFY